MGTKIYTSNNIKVGSSDSGIKWYIRQMSPTEYPNYETLIPTMEGKMGDVIVVTDTNISKLKYVANIFEGSDQQNNSINIYINENSSEKRIHFFDGWYFDAKFNSQSILLNNENLFCPVYFWDEYQHKFIAIQVGYVFKDILSIYSFTGKDLDVDTYWGGPVYSEVVNPIHIIPIVSSVTDNVNVDSFVGMGIDLEDYWNDISYTEETVIKVNNVIIE